MCEVTQTASRIFRPDATVWPQILLTQTQQLSESRCGEVKPTLKSSERHHPEPEVQIWMEDEGTHWRVSPRHMWENPTSATALPSIHVLDAYHDKTPCAPRCSQPRSAVQSNFGFMIKSWAVTVHKFLLNHHSTGSASAN